MDLPTFIAHRGYPNRYPENTLVGIEAALAAGAEYFECDLQMLTDNELILMHDDSLLRSSGINKSVFSLRRETVKNFKADFFTQFSNKFSGTKIPLLEDLLSLLDQYQQATVLLEIKTESIDNFGAEHVVKHLLNTLKGYESRCYIISFSAEALHLVKQHQQFRTGYVLHHYDEAQRLQAEQLQAELLICNHAKIPLDEDNENQLMLWPGDWQWCLYVVDNFELAVDYSNMGITYIETDNIGLMLDIANQYQPDS